MSSDIIYIPAKHLLIVGLVLLLLMATGVAYNSGRPEWMGHDAIKEAFVEPPISEYFQPYLEMSLQDIKDGGWTEILCGPQEIKRAIIDQQSHICGLKSYRIYDGHAGKEFYVDIPSNFDWGKGILDCHCGDGNPGQSVYGSMHCISLHCVNGDYSSDCDEPYTTYP